MKTKIVAAVAVLVAVALTGCAAAGPGSTPASPPPTPEDLLVKAVPADDSVKYRFAVKGTDTPVSGVLDAAAHSYTYGVTQVNATPHFKMTMDFLFIRSKTWVKIKFSEHAGVTGLPTLPDKWLLVDPAKVHGDTLPKEGDDTTDPGATGAIMDGIVTARQTAPGHFAGTTDLTKNPDAGIVDTATLKALGARAKSLAFKAETDGSGRLSSVLLEIPTAGKTKAHTYAVRYTAYATAPTPPVPAATEQQKAPAVAYQMLND